MEEPHLEDDGTKGIKIQTMTKPHRDSEDKEITAENLERLADEERTTSKTFEKLGEEEENLNDEERTTANARHYAQWKMDTLSAQVGKQTKIAIKITKPKVFSRLRKSFENHSTVPQKSGPQSHAASYNHAMMVADVRANNLCFCTFLVDILN